MRTLSGILLILIVLTAASVCRGDQLLDQARKALSDGNTAEAAEIYHQAASENPTAEAYNNLGVALERSGEFAEAAVAYGNALLLPHDDNKVEANLKRARLRTLIQTGSPYAASVFAGLLAIFLMAWTGRRLAAFWRAWRYRIKFGGVRLVSLTHRVLCPDGQCQPDGKAYPDSEQISVTADIALPKHRDIYPLHLELLVIRPDGAVWRTLSEVIETPRAARVKVSFEIEQVGELLDFSGSWQLRLVLQNTRRHLATTRFAVVRRSDLVADLKVRDIKLLAIRGSTATQEKVIFPDVEALVPVAVIRPGSFHPSKFADIRLRLDLISASGRDDIETQEFPLELTQGVMTFCPVSRRISDDPIIRKVGRWEFRLSAEGRCLARMPFTIASVERAVEGLKVESFDLAGILHSGEPCKVENAAYVRNLRSLCPIIRVTSKMPSPKTGFRMAIGVCLDGEPAGGVEGRLVLDGTTAELMPGEFHLPGIPEGHDTVRVSFVLLVEGRNLGIREVTLRSRPPRCTDSQGRITDLPATEATDYAREAERILREARIG